MIERDSRCKACVKEGMDALIFPVRTHNNARDNTSFSFQGKSEKSMYFRKKL